MNDTATASQRPTVGEIGKRWTLAPCPFCSGHAKLYTYFGGACVRCTACAAKGQACDSTDDAVAFWNARPAPQSAPAVDRPTIVCLCGSTRFGPAFRDANLRETLAGRIVLSIGCDMRSDDDVFGSMPEDQRAATKAALDALHLRKVELSDEVLILNVGGYIGESTARELAHARAIGKVVRLLEPAP